MFLTEDLLSRKDRTVVVGDMLDGFRADGKLARMLELGRWSGRFRGSPAVCDGNHPGHFEAVEIGRQKESRAIAGPALMAIQGRAPYLCCFNLRTTRAMPPSREAIDSGLTLYQRYCNSRTR